MATPERRYGGMTLGGIIVIAGILILIVWSFWGWVTVLRANSFAAVAVRVQGERNHTVISTGPYAVVRHPMYAYAIPSQSAPR